MSKPDTSLPAIEQFKRDAKRLAQKKGIRLSSAREEVARKKGFSNWHHLEETLTAQQTQNAAPVDEEPMTESLRLLPDVIRDAYKLYFQGDFRGTLLAAEKAINQMPKRWEGRLLVPMATAKMVEQLPGDQAAGARPGLVIVEMNATDSLRKLQNGDRRARIALAFQEFRRMVAVSADSREARLEIERHAQLLMRELRLGKGAHGTMALPEGMDAAMLDIFSETASIASRFATDAESRFMLLASAVYLAMVAGNNYAVDEMTGYLSPVDRDRLATKILVDWGTEAVKRAMSPGAAAPL